MTDARTVAEIAADLDEIAKDPMLRAYIRRTAKEAAAKIRALEGALKPFAAFVDPLESLGGPSRLTDDDSIFYSISNRGGDHTLTLGRFRAARSALGNAND